MMAQTLFGFGLTFVGGPALFTALMRLSPGPGAILGLGAGILACVFVGIMETLAPVQQARGAFVLTPGLLAMWLAWVLATAMIVLVLRSRTAEKPLSRRVFWAGLIATMLPWLAMAAARGASA